MPTNLRVSRSVRFLSILTFALVMVRPAAAQDWFRTGTGIGVEKYRVATADFATRNQGAGTFANTFNAVLYADLEYSGIIEMVSKSFYPLKQPSIPAELKHAEWNADPVLAHMVALGNLSSQSDALVIEAWLFDVRSPDAPAALAKRYRGAATEADARRFAHQFADEIISRLSGGLPGIAGTQIVFVSNRTGSKEVWVMDSDGAGQRPLTSLHSIALTPRWSPDASRVAFTCYSRGPDGVTSAQICMHSMDTGKLVAFVRYRGTNSSPAWSPDGTKIMFMSSQHGDPELFTVDVATGRDLKRITYSAGGDTSPAWNPKTGQTVAFVSDRGGIPQLYMMNADGTNVQKMVLDASMGYVIDPAWSPNGELLAFSWRRPSGNYDIYVMNPANGEIVELTRDAGRNERPWWAPDGRHLVFESTRTGSRQIWTMLADGTMQRQLTFEGNNESPNWSPR